MKLSEYSVPLPPGDPERAPPPASLRRRAAAAVIDLVVILGIDFALASGFGSEIEPMRWELKGLPACGLMLFLPSYWLVPETLFGATLGKALLGLRIYSLRGADLTFSQVLKRDLVKALDAADLYMMGFVVSLSNPLRQTPGDLWAGTMVVEAASLARWKASGSGLGFEDWLKSFPATSTPAQEPGQTDRSHAKS